MSLFRFPTALSKGLFPQAYFEGPVARSGRRLEAHGRTGEAAPANGMASAAGAWSAAIKAHDGPAGAEIDSWFDRKLRAMRLGLFGVLHVMNRCVSNRGWGP